MKRAKGVTWLLLMLPGILFVAVFMLIPLCLLAVTTVSPHSGSFSLSAYFEMFGGEYFRQVFSRSLRLSLLSTAVCAVLGFPTAYYISRFSKRKGLLMVTSPVIRSFSWMVILGKKGIVNSMLVGSGLFEKPQSLLYNEFSMTVGFVQLFLPLMILSLIGVMDSIPDELSLAACNLGATRLRAFFSVVFPLSISGLVTGSVLVFTGCLTAYTTPQLLGGTDTRVLATVIYQYAMSLGDWMQAAVVAVTMIVVTVVVSVVFNAVSKRINPMA